MRTTLIFSLVVIFHMIVVTPVLAQLKKIRFSTTGISISELPFKVAQLKGFWREEGLDVETILIRGAVGMQALSKKFRPARSSTSGLFNEPCGQLSYARPLVSSVGGILGPQFF
jgi:hypothetical protein